MYEVTYDSDGSIRSIGKINMRYLKDPEHPPEGVLYTDTIPEGMETAQSYKVQNGELVYSPREVVFNDEPEEEEITYG